MSQIVCTCICLEGQKVHFVLSDSRSSHEALLRHVGRPRSSLAPLGGARGLGDESVPGTLPRHHRPHPDPPRRPRHPRLRLPSRGERASALPSALSLLLHGRVHAELRAARGDRRTLWIHTRGRRHTTPRAPRTQSGSANRRARVDGRCSFDEVFFCHSPFWPICHKRILPIYHPHRFSHSWPIEARERES